MSAPPENPHSLPAGETQVSASAAADQTLQLSSSVAPRDPVWDGWDLLRVMIIAALALVVSVMATLLIAKRWIYPHLSMGEISRNGLALLISQSLGYLITLLYMVLLVTRERRQSNFFAAIHWNWPASPGLYVIFGFILSIALEWFAQKLPIPKNLPIDRLFQTPAEAWALTIFGVVLAPLMEELFFRAFLYPVLARRFGIAAAIAVTAAAFALLHGSQLMFAWGPVLLIFIVGLVLTGVRAIKNSVAAGLIIHVAYNATISAALFFRTDGFQHLERLGSQ